MDTNTSKLQENLGRLKAEQAALQSELTTTKARLAQVETERKAAQRSYDTGHDSALATVESLTTERGELEAAILRIDRSLAEYPERLRHIQDEIGIATHRDNLRALLELRRLEWAALNEFEQATLDFIAAFDCMADTHAKRKALAGRLESSARQFNLGPFERGDVNIPSARSVGEWLEASTGLQMAEAAFAKVRGQWVEVE